MVKKKKSIKRNNQKKLFSIVGAILLVLAGITIAYAALSATLNITINKVTQNAQTWNVQFDTTAVTPTVTGSGATCPSVTPTATAVSIGDITLDYPGDKCVYELKIKNTGTIAAKVTGITKIGSACSALTATNKAEFNCGTVGTTNPYINVKITQGSATGSIVTSSSPASYAASSSTSVWLTLEHNSSATTTIDTTTSFSNIGFSFTFGQN